MDVLYSTYAQYLTCLECARQVGGRSLQWTGLHFKDEGYSGSTLDRPGMRDLRQAIKDGEIDLLYAVALLDEFEKAGVPTCPLPALTSLVNDGLLAAAAGNESLTSVEVR